MEICEGLVFELSDLEGVDLRSDIEIESLKYLQDSWLEDDDGNRYPTSGDLVTMQFSRDNGLPGECGVQRYVVGPETQPPYKVDQVYGIVTPEQAVFLVNYEDPEKE